MQQVFYYFLTDTEIKLKDHYFLKIQLVLEKHECKKDKLDFQAMIYEQLCCFEILQLSD